MVADPICQSSAISDSQKKTKKHVHIFEVENEISNIIHVTSLGESWEYDSYCILLLPPNLSSHTCTVSCDKWFEPRCIRYLF